MVRTFIMIPIISFVTVSCSLNSIESEIDSINERVSILEESVTAVNDNAIAVQTLMDDSIVIMEYTHNDYSWQLTLNNGMKLTVTDGLSSPSSVPIIGIDSDGHWIMSLDGGETFIEIPGTTDYDAGYGHTPQLAADEFGYWIMSMDGTHWSRILDSKGNPISADDGREVAGAYAFFSHVLLSENGDEMLFHLLTGEVLHVPVLIGGGLIVDGYTGRELVFAGRSMEYPVKVADVKGAVWENIPTGWRVKLTDEKLVFMVPDDAAPGDYDFTLITTSSKGVSKVYKFTLTCSGYIFEDNFDKDGIPDKRYWELCPRRYVGIWSSYMSESYDQAYVKDGNLVLIAENDSEKGMLSGGIKTEGKVSFQNCLVEIRARFSKTSQGVVAAGWLFPYPQSIWPFTGEIDIYEHLNHESGVWQTIHTGFTLYDPTANSNDSHKYANIIQGDYNVYGAAITPDYIIFYINGVETFRYGKKPYTSEDAKRLEIPDNKYNPFPSEKIWKVQFPFYDQDYYVLLDNCLGMQWPGEPDLTQLPSRCEVDWVRVSKL